MIKIFIGYDSRERVATNLLIDSLNKFSSQPLSITLIKRSQLKGILTRPRGTLEGQEERFKGDPMQNIRRWLARY